MALKGSTVREQIWNYMASAGLSNHGVAGLMGNLSAESRLNPKNLEDLCEARLKEAGKLYCTDETYTVAVDSGEISQEEFLHPLPNKQYGYGLAQWTSPGRKAGLYDLAKSRGVSIGDLEMQLDFLMQELSTSYRNVLEILKSATSVRAASDAVLIDFERPKNQGEAVKKKRAGYGQKYYDEFVKPASVNTAGTSTKPEGGKATMTETQARQHILSIMQGWVGLKRADGSHKVIIDTYNEHKPLARSYAVKYTDAYCATTVSAAAIKAGFDDIIPLECGCGQLIELARKMGIWEESDAHVPEPADIILYDWEDNGIGDNTGWPDHVGMVEKVAGSTITVIEGNMSGGVVGRRNLQVNGRYIRGYILPKYAGKADKPNEPNTSGNLKVGDIVSFTGKNHYASSYASAKKVSCMSGQAKVTAINEKGAHPYHLVAVPGKGSNVYGWVDAADIQGAASGSGSSGGTAAIKVGDTVNYSGNIHYTSSYKGAKSSACKGGTAKVTAINKTGAHPYHLKHTGSGCTVYGWVDADKVSRS